MSDVLEVWKEYYAKKMQEEVQGPMDEFDKAFAKTVGLPPEEQIKVLWGTVRPLYERMLLLEYELKHRVGLFGF